MSKKRARQVAQSLADDPSALQRYNEFLGLYGDEERRHRMDSAEPRDGDSLDMVERELEDGWPYADDDAA